MGREFENAPVKIRSLLPDDIAFALEQTEREEWDVTATFFSVLLAHDPDGCFVAEYEGRRAGIITTTRYRDSAWVGNVVVPTEFRKRSIGSNLMTHALAHLEARGVQTIRLEADPPGINIYRRAGFIDEFESPRFRIDRCSFTRPANVIVLHDPLEVLDLDLQIFGDDRSRLLPLLFAQGPAAYKTERKGRATGYILLQPSSIGCRIGPWIAEDPETAGELLAAALSTVADKTIVIALPGVNQAGVDLLSSVGFRRTPSSFRMIRGPAAATGMPEKVYALAGGSIG